jgi:hypothetical protein
MSLLPGKFECWISELDFGAGLRCWIGDVPALIARRSKHVSSRVDLWSESAWHRRCASIRAFAKHCLQKFTSRSCSRRSSTLDGATSHFQVLLHTILLRLQIRQASLKEARWAHHSQENRLEVEYGARAPSCMAPLAQELGESQMGY